MNDGHWIQYYSQDTEGATLVKTGAIEELLNQVIIRIVKPGFVTVDLGANYGVTSFAIAQMVGPQGVVYAIEANRPVWELMVNNTILNGYSKIVKPYNRVISDQTGDAYFIVNLTHSYMGYVSYNASESSEKISAVTVDLFLEQMNETRPLDYLRLDIQGFECKAIKGAGRTIARNHNIIIFFEWESLMALKYMRKGMLSKCLNSLEQQGFKFWALPRDLDSSKASMQTLSLTTGDQLLEYKYPKEIIAVRNNTILEGLYEPEAYLKALDATEPGGRIDLAYIRFKSEITFDDFWLLPKSEALQRIKSPQFEVNKPCIVNSQKFLLDRLIQCYKQNLNCSNGSDIYEVLEELKRLGEKCSQSMHSFFKKYKKYKPYQQICF